MLPTIQFTRIKSWASQLLTDHIPWKELRAKVRMRYSGLWENWQDRPSQLDIFRSFLWTSILMSPQTYKSTETISCLFFMTSSNLLPRWCLNTCSLFTKSCVYQPPSPYLFAVVIRETLSQVINLNLAWIKIFISFLDWLPIILSVDHIQF